MSAFTSPFAAPASDQPWSFCRVSVIALPPLRAKVMLAMRYCCTPSRSLRRRSASLVVALVQMSDGTVTTGSRPMVRA